jgi:hypothetical protein
MVNATGARSATTGTQSAAMDVAQPANTNFAGMGFFNLNSVNNVTTAILTTLMAATPHAAW